MTLDDALLAYVEAGQQFKNIATEEVTRAVLARYPDAHRARVIGIVDDDYSEHSIEVYNEGGDRLDLGDDWPFDWALVVTEGVCVFDNSVEVPLWQPSPAGI